MQNWVNLSNSYLLTDFDALEICCQDRHSEQPFPTHISGVRFSSYRHKSVRYLRMNFNSTLFNTSVVRY